MATCFRGKQSMQMRRRRITFRPHLESLEERTVFSAGDFDPTFGINGRVTTDFGAADVVNSVAIQPDQMLVAVGTSGALAALSRYRTDGSLDPDFGAGGRVTVAFGPGMYGIAEKVILQPDGKIVIAGGGGVAGSATDQHWFLLRLDSTGQRDAGFGVDGFVYKQFGSTYETALDVLLQPDGKIVATGYAGESYGAYDSILLRLNSNGSLDDGSANDSTIGDSFGEGGFVQTDVASSDAAWALALQPDGKLITVGTSGGAFPNDDVYMVRYNADGGLDSGFGSGGIVTTNLSGRESGNAIALHENGKILVGGSTSIHGFQEFSLTRFQSDGQLDTSFGENGVATAGLSTLYYGAESLAIQSDGKILAAGTTVNGNGQDKFGLARFNADGGLDHSFGAAGTVLTLFGGAFAQAHELCLQPDGKIVLGGYAESNPGNIDFAVARYEGDTLPHVNISINDATEVIETDDGEVYAQFIVNLSAAIDQVVSVQYTTTDGTATSGKDFEASTGTVTFAPNQTTATISIKVFGERLDEQDESFRIVLFSPSTNALVADGDAIGTISDDDTSLFVITHGFQVDDELPPWVRDMASAIKARAGFALPAKNILMFDWAILSSTPGIADEDAVAGALANHVRNSLAELSVYGPVDLHFIGHSRGCFVNAEVIHRLKEMGLESQIDFLQMTTLDPRDWGNDGWRDHNSLTANPGGIVDWADNYYETSSVTNSEPIPGALNVNLTQILEGWYGRGGIAADHKEVHDWYHWTIDTDDASLLPVYSDPDLISHQQTFLNEQTNPTTRDLLFSNLDLDGDDLFEDFARGSHTGFFWSAGGEGLASRPLVVTDIQFQSSDKKLNRIDIYFNRSDINWSASGVTLWSGRDEIHLNSNDIQFDTARGVLSLLLTNYNLRINDKFELRFDTQCFSAMNNSAVRLVDDDGALDGSLDFKLNLKKKVPYTWA